MKRLLTVVLLLTGIVQSRAQQDLMVSHYMFNHLLVNPGYAGSKDYMMATLLYRKQWANLKGAPESQVATLHGPLGLTNFGWGGTISHDRIGVTDRTDIWANASYQMRVSQKYKLGMGLRVGGGYYNFKNSELIFWDEADPAFAGDQVTTFRPNVGAGLFFYSDKLYTGVSLPTIIAYDTSKGLSIDIQNGQVVPHQVRHLFVEAGYAFEFNRDVVMKPSMLLKYVGNAPVEADFNLNFLLMQTLWVGAGYRTGDCLVAMLEVQLSKQWRIGYSYDFTTTEIKNYSSGSHEIMIGYDFGYDIMKVKTPRYF